MHSRFFILAASGMHVLFALPVAHLLSMLCRIDVGLLSEGIEKTWLPPGFVFFCSELGHFWTSYAFVLTPLLPVLLMLRKEAHASGCACSKMVLAYVMMVFGIVVISAYMLCLPFFQFHFMEYIYDM